MFCCSSPCCKNGFAFKFFCPSAADADHMVMLTMIFDGQLEASSTLTEFQFLEQSHVGQEAQGAIHRGQGHLHVECRQLLVHLLGTEVATGSTVFKQFKNTFALRGESTPVLMQAPLQSCVS